MRCSRGSIHFLVMASLLVCAPAASAQRAARPKPAIVQIRGQVRFPNSASGPYGAMVTLDLERGGFVAQAQTDSQGKFLFSDIGADVYVIKVRHPGYHEASQRVDLTMGSTRYVMFDLQPLPGNMPPNSPPTGSVDVATLRGGFPPEDAQKELEEGRTLLLEKKDPEKSIPHIRKAIGLFPAYAPSHLLLGTAYMDLKKWKEAQSEFEKATQVDEKLAAAYLALGACLNLQGNFGAAEKPLLRGLELNAETADGHFELGRAYWALNRWQEAEPHARKALAIRPDNAPAHLLLGNILLRKREAKEALGEFKEYLRLAPDGPFAAPTRQLVAKIEQALAGTPR